MAKIGLRNDTNLKFIDISGEKARTYHYRTTEQTIDSPAFLNVSDSGGHRILDEAGVSHYIPKGWIRLSWIAKDGSPHFVK